MQGTGMHNVDDELFAELLRRRSQPFPRMLPGSPTPNDPPCPKDKPYPELRRELDLNVDGSKKHRNSARSGPFPHPSKRASTQSERARISRPCTPPNKMIPPYGLFPRHERPSTPPMPRQRRPSTPPTPSRPPSLCGSSIPSANTTPQKRPYFFSSPVSPSPENFALNQSKRPRRHLTEHGDHKSKVAPASLLKWLDSTADKTSSRNFEDDPLILNENRDTSPSVSPQSDECSLEGSVSDIETWGESSSSEDERAVLPTQFRQFLQSAVKNLYMHFQEWKTETGHQTRGERQGSHQSGTKSAFANTTALYTQPEGKKSNKGPRKRRSGDEDEDQASKLPRLDISGEDQDTRLLACPFAKRNPLQHRKCFKYVLQEIARLKQHLLRVHQVPIHCARCSKVFDRIEDRDFHSRQPECIVQPPQIFDGINESQRLQLKKRISSKKSREENWYLIYEILFPAATRPESPYIEDICLSEEILAIREFATQAGPARVAAFVNSHLPPSLRSNQQHIELFTQAAVRDVFDMILESWDSSCQSGQSSIQNTPHRSTPGRSSSVQDSGFSSAGPPSGSSGYSSGGGSRFSIFDDNPVPRPSFAGPLPSAQELDQVTSDAGFNESGESAPRRISTPLPSAHGLDLVTPFSDGSRHWDYDTFLGTLEIAQRDFLLEVED